MGKKKPKLQKRKSTTKSPPWTDLPIGITENILQRLDAIDVLDGAQNVCTTWRNVFKDPATWRVIRMKNIGGHVPHSLEIMCRHAVDRSEGHLIDIKIDSFGSDELLHYIADRSSELKCLGLACRTNISGKGLSEAVVKIPNLEELHLSLMPSIRAQHIVSIGRSCHKLKSFSLNDKSYKFPHINEDDEYALAVAENMHGLRHLKLFGNKMTNRGVEAILDGCPNLESLDLRQCFNVDLQGDLGKRCSQQIKGLRRPLDSTDDYEWDSKTYDYESCYYSGYFDYWLDDEFEEDDFDIF